jgi:hypothetical protein
LIPLEGNTIQDPRRNSLRATIWDSCIKALQRFCKLHWPCEFSNNKGRCVNVRAGHTKGHQNDQGRLIRTGQFKGTFTFDSFEGKWRRYLQDRVHKLQQEIRDSLAGHSLDEGKVPADKHRRIMRRFYHRLGGAHHFNSHYTCFCCLTEMPKYPLPCGHVLCLPCVSDYGSRDLGCTIKLDACPLHASEPFNRPWYIKDKPDMAGVRILSLDG